AAAGGVVRLLGRVAGASARVRRDAGIGPGRPRRVEGCALITSRSHARDGRAPVRWYLGPPANVPAVDRARGAGVRQGIAPPPWAATPARRGSFVGRSPCTTRCPAARQAGKPLATHETSSKPADRRSDAATLERMPEAQIGPIGRSGG